MSYKYKIRSVDKENGYMVIEFEGCPPINFRIPDNGTRFLTGQEMENAIQQMYPWEIKQKELYSKFAEPSDLLARVEPFPPYVPTADDIRNDRNFLLAQCDWTQVADVPLTSEQKTAWSTYRQALRDITTQSGFPTAVDWPVAPQ